ncbi:MULTISPECIES: glycosyltransferase [Prevotella]|uniref:Glycosyltransferase 2-like domain-containing protein n=1 Tax=Prevotella herbatica TaxID=2801997 RepID=A0ABM7NUQ7_9BACT|nr:MULTISPECIES: glycosyltransferase [Prevotella]MDN5554063.1 glycosyltransferase [Prevotella sp.]BCS84149.1 hypothetical protein prwr041_00420 [Prevotella herbatica]
MIIDQLTIILGIIVILLAIVASLASPFLHRIKIYESENNENDINDNPIPVSIIIPTHDDSTDLQRNLPAFLNQDYKGDFKIIVIADRNDRETEDLMNRLIPENKNLYATYLPESSRYMSRKKLAITIGVKAAKTDWIIVTDPCCKPLDEKWLSSFTENMKPGTDFVMGYTSLDNNTRKFWRFEHALIANNRLYSAQKGKAWATNCQNIAFHKQQFMNEEGFRGNLQLLRGEYDFLVNKYAKDMNTTVDARRSSWLYEDEPTRKTWHNKSIYFRASRSLLMGHKGNRIYMFFCNMMLHLSLIVSLTAIVYSVIQQNWILTGASGLSLLLLIITRTIFANRAIKQLDEDIPAGIMFFSELKLAWNNIRYKISYIHADKNDFTSHKL